MGYNKGSLTGDFMLKEFILAIFLLLVLGGILYLNIQENLARHPHPPVRWHLHF